MRSQVKFWLGATTSALAICAASQAEATLYQTPGVVVGGFTAPVSGVYEIIASGAQGGAAHNGANAGSLGALVGARSTWQPTRP